MKKFLVLGVMLLSMMGYSQSEVYPNPVKSGDDLNIDIDYIKFNEVDIKLYDINGIEMRGSIDIKKFKLNIIDEKLNIIINCYLPTGIYLMRIISNNKVEVKKIIIN